MKKLILVDGNSIIFRAYYATAYPGATLMQTSSGIYTNALFAFINMINKIKELSFDHILFAFDTSEPTKRHILYEDYKAGRKAMPEELGMQFALVEEYLDVLGYSYYQLPGYEADDIIGTLSKEAANLNYQVSIFSSDRDLLQLVNDQVSVHLIKRGMQDVVDYTPKMIQEEFGLKCSQMIDFKALTGDPSDNIPGIPGVGPKTAQKLLNDYETLEGVLANGHLVKGVLGQRIRDNHELAKMSKMLVTIDQEMKLPFKVSDLKPKAYLVEDLISFYQKYELHSLARQLIKSDDLVEVETFDYIEVKSEEQLADILKSELSFYLELDDENYHHANIWGLGISNGDNSYFVEPELLLSSLSLKEYLENSKISKNGYNIKSFYGKLKYHNISIKSFDYDLLLASYLINPNLGKEELARIGLNFDYDKVQYDEIIYGKGAKRGLPDDANIYKSHIASKALAIHKLKDVTLGLIKDANQLELLNEIEIPLSYILADMEITGIKINQVELTKQHEQLSRELEEITTNVYQLTGEEFNLNSPKQLGDILFEKLNLPHGKKTKTGYSTNQEVLNKLKGTHPVINEILRYRTLAKLFQTYVNGISDALSHDGKIHSIYQQALTTTGRLSSTEPNLQNIPVRTHEGREIRKLFVSSSDDAYLISADYSQIELRVLAHISGDKELINAFNSEIDIHSQTAREVFGIKNITPEMRYAAKAVNFGIIYGISDWGLAEDLQIPVQDAQKYINKYLEVYPQVQKYMMDIVQSARELGYVATIFNRRRYLPEITSPVFMQRKFGERLALNAPIQGSAADILKKAMVDLYQYIKQNNKDSKILLQVHDELILEVPSYELKEMKQVIPEIMSNAVNLKVKTPISLAVGKSWYEI